MGYIYLFVAILAEVIATSLLKSTEEFTKLGPSIVVAIGYCVAFYFLSIVIKSVPIGIAYAIWSGLGIVLISLVGVFVMKQKLDWAAILGMILITAGVIVINLFSKTKVH